MDISSTDKNIEIAYGENNSNNNHTSNSTCNEKPKNPENPEKYNSIKPTLKEHIGAFIKSITMNYKSWIFIIASISYISYSNIPKGLLTFGIFLLLVHISHYGCHIEILYPFNIIHQYHHKNHDFIDLVCLNNVFVAINEIKARSPILKEMADKGEIRIVGAVYDMNTGIVKFLE